MVRHGFIIIARNVRIGRGELDIVARHNGVMVAVEVKTVTDPKANPFRSFTADKAAQVKRLARIHGCQRSDLVVVQLAEAGVLFRWLPAQ